MKLFQRIEPGAGHPYVTCHQVPALNHYTK